MPKPKSSRKIWINKVAIFYNEFWENMLKVLLRLKILLKIYVYLK